MEPHPINLENNRAPLFRLETQWVRRAGNAQSRLSSTLHRVVTKVTSPLQDSQKDNSLATATELQPPARRSTDRLHLQTCHTHHDQHDHFLSSSSSILLPPLYDIFMIPRGYSGFSGVKVGREAGICGVNRTGVWLDRCCQEARHRVCFRRPGTSGIMQSAILRLEDTS